MSASSKGSDAVTSFDAVIVGAGFSGLYMLHRLRGLGLAARVIEAGSGVGGTWYWNRYPGARVDIESQEYSFAFDEALEREWTWTERYAPQPELLNYANHVADRYDLRRDIQFNTRVEQAVFDEAASRWTVRTDRGDVISARYCIMATGCLSLPNEPKFQGQERFKGATYHTGRWPHEPVDFTGKTVGVIGTGSSAIQSIPVIASQARHVYVFQRTPNFSVPAHNAPIDEQVVAEWQAKREENRAAQRMSQGGFTYHAPRERLVSEAPPEEHRAEFEARWARGGFAMLGAFADVAIDADANKVAADFVAEKIRAIVKDKATAEKLVPKSYPFGTKRLCVDTGYYETFNRGNVTLIDLQETPLSEITETGVSTTDATFDVDAIVFAIGFDAMTGALSKIDIKGRGGVSLNAAWAEGPKTYLGLMVAGFPNLFTITGPGSPSVLSNMIVSIEQHVDWIADCLRYMGERQLSVMEASIAAQEGWVAHVNEAASMTLFPQANSWYLGANVPGKPRVFMPYVGGVGVYRELCDQVAAKDYEGFALSPA
jgi:cyclohexanone monooxygenase